MQRIWCQLEFSTMKMMYHVHPRCNLVRDQTAKGGGNEDAEVANGPCWDPNQPLPPAPLVRDAIPAENLRGQRRDEYQWQRAREEEQLEMHNQRANKRDRAAARNTQDPDHEEAMRDPRPVELEAMMATLSLFK
jgi:hypothetical protein